MPSIIHTPSVRGSIEARLGRLRPDSKGVWGRMTVDQMLWHVNQALGTALGRVQPAPDRMPIPTTVMRFAVLKLPWTRNAPTNRAFVTRDRHDFEAERARCRALIDEIVARDIEVPPPNHPAFGQMTGRQQSHLHAKHLDHHLRQFGV